MNWNDIWISYWKFKMNNYLPNVLEVKLNCGFYLYSFFFFSWKYWVDWVCHNCNKSDAPSGFQIFYSQNLRKLFPKKYRERGKAFFYATDCNYSFAQIKFIFWNTFPLGKIFHVISFEVFYVTWSLGIYISLDILY